MQAPLPLSLRVGRKVCSADVSRCGTKTQAATDSFQPGLNSSSARARRTYGQRQSGSTADPRVQRRWSQHLVPQMDGVGRHAQRRPCLKMTEGDG